MTQQPNLLYKSFLESLCVGTENDLCFLRAIDSSGQAPCIPADDTRQWRIPTNEYLAKPEWDRFLHFHPLCESSLRQESQAQKWISKLIAARITQVLTLQMETLLEIGSDIEIHKTLKGERHKVLSVLANVSDGGKNQTLKDWTALSKKISLTGDHRIYRLYIKKTGVWNDATYSRVAVSRFPLYEELVSDSPTVFGVKLSNKKTRENLVKLMEYLLPGIEDSNTYNYGSSNMTAVNFHATAMGFATIARALNKTSKLFSDFFDSNIAMDINLDWVPMMDQIGQWRDTYSIFDESAGESDAKADQNAGSFDPNRLTREVAATPLAPTRTTQGQQQSDNNFVKPEPKADTGGRSVKDFLGGGNNQQSNQFNQQQNNGFNNGFTNNQNQVYFNNLSNPQPQQPMQQQRVVGASGLVRNVNTGFNNGFNQGHRSWGGI